MRINHITLKNFSAIENAMHANKVHIDLTQMKNRICILIGPNASGKTTILSMLHPFADLGNLDVRNGNNYILEGKSGYKEIEIDYNGDIYTIKHFYSPHDGKSHSVKSYIAKNGVELNTNGNVSSFKEYVREELSIEPEYLKLIRLGSNVTNLINLSATERKNFMSKILEDIDIYLEYYKSVSAKLRELSSIISHDEDRLNRLNIIDVKITKDEIAMKEEHIAVLEKEYMDYSNQVAIHEEVLKTMDPADLIKEKLSSARHKLHRMEKTRERVGSYESVEYYDKEILQLEKDNIALSAAIQSSSSMLNEYLTQLDNLSVKKGNLAIQYEKERNIDKELHTMKENLVQLRKRMNQYEENTVDFKPACTKDEYEALLIALEKCDNILRAMYEVGKKPVEKVVDLFRKKKNIQRYIDTHRIAIGEQNGHSDTVFIQSMIRLIASKPNEEVVINCKEECIAKEVFQRIKGIISNNEISDKPKELEFYDHMEIAYKNFYAILQILQDNQEIIKKLDDPIKEIFLTENLLKHVEKLERCYDDDRLNTYYSRLVEYDNLIKTKEEYQKQEENYERFKLLQPESRGSEMLEALYDEIEELQEKIESERTLMITNKDQVLENEKTIETDKDIRELLSDYDNTVTEFKKLNGEYDECNKRSDAVVELVDKMSDVSNQIDWEKRELQELTTNLKMYKDISKQLKKSHKIYDDMILVKEALSVKEGIPLQFITGYLGNVEEITNELLDIVYHGDTYIDNFVITPTEFSIPFYHNGVRLSDVKYGSQGELSFLSLALSFALSAQSISDYNILLYDEVDGALDTRNRSKFIDILENQIDRVSSEQNFLITHNNMFSSYPVDILDLSFQNNEEEYPLANFIKIERE